MKMKLNYCRNTKTNNLGPACWFNKKYDVFGSFIIDSMGLELNSKEFIEDLEDYLDYLKTNEYPKELYTNSWGMEIKKLGEKAFIYFLFDDTAVDYQTEIEENKIIFFLEKWVNFLKLDPKEGYEEIWEI